MAAVVVVLVCPAAIIMQYYAFVSCCVEYRIIIGWPFDFKWAAINIHTEMCIHKRRHEYEIKFYLLSCQAHDTAIDLFAVQIVLYFMHSRSSCGAVYVCSRCVRYTMLSLYCDVA